MKKQRFSLITLAAACIAIPAFAGTAAALEEFAFHDKANFTIGADPDLSIETLSGDITYVGADTDEASVTITIAVRAADEEEARAIRDAVDIAVDGGPGFLDAMVKRPVKFHKWLRREFGRNRGISVSFEVHGPQRATGELYSVSGSVELSGSRGMEIETVSGDIAAREIDGRLRAQSVSGSVEVFDCARSARITSVSGDLHVGDCKGDLSVRSTSGKITVVGVGGDIESGTVSGDIELTRVGGAVSAKTTSGAITVEHETGDLDVHTLSGDIEARSGSESHIFAKSMSGTIAIAVDPDNIGEVVLETFSGDIETETPLRLRRHSRNRLTGTMGSGEAKLEVETHSGDIILSAL